MPRFLRFLRPQAVPTPVDRTQVVTYDDVWVVDDGTPDRTQVVTYDDVWTVSVV